MFIIKISVMTAINTLNNLIKLTDEPDENLYSEIAKNIMYFGATAIPLLKKNLGRNIGYIQKERIESLIYNIENHIIINKIQQWKNNGASNILEPCLLLGKHRFPHTDWSMLTFQLMLMVEQIDQELNRTITPLEQIKVINHIIYNINNINGNISTLKNPDFYYINTLFETRIGNPLSIGILYISVAQRLNIPIYGIDLPQHFVLAYIKDNIKMPKAEDVLFYINPFNKGIILTKNEILHYLKGLGIKPENKHFSPMNNIQIINKLLRTLIETCSRAGDYKQAQELTLLL